MAAFKIGINMAGAISAGAYTAGVLDFLTEALDEWYKAKARGDAVPGHDVSIEVFSGASAGGMCAAISAVMLQDDFEHIHDVNKRNTNNRFYESWVNQIDITDLLKTDDLKKNGPVVSLLNSSIIEQIARYALTSGGPLPPPRPYVSPDLTLFLSLTNLRGIPYSLNAAAPGSIEETTFYYGDRICFRISHTGTGSLLNGSVRMLNLDKPGTDGGWDVLQTAAMATGAFPLFLAPRVLQRYFGEYVPPIWESAATDPAASLPVKPSFPPKFDEPFPTLNVDGGVTNNDPFNYARDYLASLTPALKDSDGSSALAADRAVINIAPFPTTEAFDASFDARKSSSLFAALGKLVSALISQSRFYGESLSQIMRGTTFSRFVIAPSDNELADEPALQCAALGAFGGFFDRGFRAHDYALGRHNCQKFLRNSFVLPVENPILKIALEKLDAAVRQKIIEDFKVPKPGSYADADEPSLPDVQQELWLPIIPLCSDAVSLPIGRPVRAHMTKANLHKIVGLILSRYGALIPHLIELIPFAPFRWFLRLGQPVIRWLARRPLTNSLIKGLGSSYVP